MDKFMLCFLAVRASSSCLCTEASTCSQHARVMCMVDFNTIDGSIVGPVGHRDAGFRLLISVLKLSRPTSSPPANQRTRSGKRRSFPPTPLSPFVSGTLASPQSNISRRCASIGVRLARPGRGVDGLHLTRFADPSPPSLLFHTPSLLSIYHLAGFCLRPVVFPRRLHLPSRSLLTLPFCLRSFLSFPPSCPSS